MVMIGPFYFHIFWKEKVYLKYIRSSPLLQTDDILNPAKVWTKLLLWTKKQTHPWAWGGVVPDVRSVIPHWNFGAHGSGSVKETWH